MLPLRFLAPAFALVLLPQAAKAVDAPPTVKVSSAARAGSGCATVQNPRAEVASDKTAIKADMPQIVTEIAGNGGVGGTFGRANCDLVVTLVYPAGWQVSPAHGTVNVIAHLAGGANGDVTFKAYQQGSTETVSSTIPLNPGDTEGHDESLTLGQAWSPCGSSATIVQSVAVKVRGGDGPSKVGARSEELSLAWRPCKVGR